MLWLGSCQRNTAGVASGRQHSSLGSLRLSPPRLLRLPWPVLSLVLLLQPYPRREQKNQPGRKLRSCPLPCIILYFPLALGSGRVAGPSGRARVRTHSGHRGGWPVWVCGPAVPPLTTPLAQCLQRAWKLKVLSTVLSWPLSRSQVRGCWLGPV